MVTGERHCPDLSHAINLQKLGLEPCIGTVRTQTDRAPSSASKRAITTAGSSVRQPDTVSANKLCKPVRATSALRVGVVSAIMRRMHTVTFCQYAEDLLLYHLQPRATGFNVDVGAVP